LKKHPSSSTSLRERSERKLREGRVPNADSRIAHETQRLFHELQVHQIELELQNEELSQANSAVSAALERFTDLYDFAPVGYFSLDDLGQILESNIAGAALLGMERSLAIGRRFQLFVEPKSRIVFQRFLDRVFSGSDRQHCEAELLRKSGDPFWAEIAGAFALTANGTKRLSRIVVSDISARKLAEKEHRHVGVLTATNRELEEEIVRRKATEASLRESEKRFRSLLNQSRLLETRLRRMTREMMEVQEKQRKEISRELHDEVSQILLGINVQLEIFAKAAATNPMEVKKAIQPMRRIVERSVRVVHEFARKLRPAMLDDLGLIPTLRSYIEALPKRKGRTIRFTADPAVEQLDNDRRTVFYRIAQEGLTNVIKHANASWVSVSLLKTRNGVFLEVADNGISFDINRLATSDWQNRLGLAGMRERVEMFGGEFTVIAVPGKGTTLRIEIPFRPPKRTRGDNTRVSQGPTQ
jgi:PAS domain S-box-containing protein